MVSNQPRHRVRLLGVQPEAWAEFVRNLGAQLAVVAASALGDVVEEDRDIQHAARSDLLEDGSRNRMIVGEIDGLLQQKEADLLAI